MVREILEAIQFALSLSGQSNLKIAQQVVVASVTHPFDVTRGALSF
jgi:hypothetical protein